jgi:hypothetical protein
MQLLYFNLSQGAISGATSIMAAARLNHTAAVEEGAARRRAAK